MTKLFFSVLALWMLASEANADTWTGYCWTSGDNRKVYITEIFNTTEEQGRNPDAMKEPFRAYVNANHGSVSPGATTVCKMQRSTVTGDRSTESSWSFDRDNISGYGDVVVILYQPSLFPPR